MNNRRASRTLQEAKRQIAEHLARCKEQNDKSPSASHVAGSKTTNRRAPRTLQGAKRQIAEHLARCKEQNDKSLNISHAAI